MPDVCTVCRRTPTTAPACDGCLTDINRQLGELPRRYAAIAGALAPHRTGPAERGAARVHAGLPVNEAALNLIGPGSDVPISLHPRIRHWSQRRTVQVTTHVVGHARTVDVTVTDWFHEPVLDADGHPEMAPDDDQIGVIPPREWLDLQTRRIRAHYRHHVPRRTLLASARRPPEPGQPPRSMRWDVEYLQTWLEKASNDGAVTIADFAAQLRSLHAEISRVLGETPDQTWVGRCPAFLAETGPDGEPTGRQRPCGAGLWQENGAHLSAQVRCPRCHSVWDTRGHAGAGTAREIRRVWPYDRRRRYTADEIDRLRRPACPGCGGPVTIAWRDVTGTRDRRRTWQPTGSTCRKGCPEARRVV